VVIEKAPGIRVGRSGEAGLRKQRDDHGIVPGEAQLRIESLARLIPGMGQASELASGIPLAVRRHQMLLAGEKLGNPLHLPLMHEVGGVLDELKAAIDGPRDRRRGTLDADAGNGDLKVGELIGEEVEEKREVGAVSH